MVEVSASILNIDEKNVIKELYNLETSGINYFHIDVMDSLFVNDNTVEKMKEYCEYIKNISNLPLDVHLMVNDIEKHINYFSIFDPNIITFHIEATQGVEQAMEIINRIKDLGIKVGISVKPNTEIEKIYELLPFVHQVLIMTVEPGKGGQKLIDTTISKVDKLKKYIDNNDLDLDIEVDGGIDTNNVDILKRAGATIVVAGTAILKSDNYKETVNRLKK